MQYCLCLRNCRPLPSPPREPGLALAQRPESLGGHLTWLRAPEGRRVSPATQLRPALTSEPQGLLQDRTEAGQLGPGLVPGLLLCRQRRQLVLCAAQSEVGLGCLGFQGPQGSSQLLLRYSRCLQLLQQLCFLSQKVSLLLLHLLLQEFHLPGRKCCHSKQGVDTFSSDPPRPHLDQALGSPRSGLGGSALQQVKRALEGVLPSI